MSSSLAVIVCKHEKTGGRKTGLHPGRLRLLARESVVAASIYEKNRSLVPEAGIFRRRGGPGAARLAARLAARRPRSSAAGLLSPVRYF